MRNWYETYKEDRECKFARYEGAEQERSIWYHGTKESNLPSILSQGLIVDPKTRAWDQDRSVSFYAPSRASIGGIYVTRSLGTARLSATHNLPKDEDRVIVMMELQPRSLVADEDDLSWPIKSVLNNPKYETKEWEIVEIFMAKELGVNPDYVNRVKDQYIQTGVRLLDEKYGPLHPKLKQRIMEILEGSWEIALNRQVSYVGEYEWNGSFYRNLTVDMQNRLKQKRNEIEKRSDIAQEQKDELYMGFINSVMPKRPDKAEYEAKFAKVLDQITRTVKDVARPLKAPNKPTSWNGRAIENIGFSGSNKIVCIVKIDKNYNVVLVYGTVPEDFKKQWQGELNIMSPKKEKKKKGWFSFNSMSATNWYKKASMAVWYHGTMIGNYSKIASEGLLARPQKRLWGKDDGSIVAPSKASLPGVYLTRELLDAINAPDNAQDAGENQMPPSKKILLAVVQADTQSLFVDEDAVSFDISLAIDDTSDYLASLIYLAGVMGLDEQYFIRIRDKYIVKMLQRIDRKFHLVHPELINRVTEILRDGFLNALTRQVAYVDSANWKKAYDDLMVREERIHKRKSNIPMPQQPTSGKGEQMFRDFMDQITRTLKFSKHQQEKENVRGEYWESGRYPNDITFSGSTKIMALIEVKIRADNRDGYIDPHQYKYRVLYGKAPQQFLDDWKRMSDLSSESYKTVEDAEEAYV